MATTATNNTAVQIFTNEQFGNVRMITINGEPYAVGKDIAQALGYAKARNAIAAHVDDEDKKVAPIQGPLGGTQEMTVINESGIYSLILSSQLPKAKEFKHWVTSEILPTIRKHGVYMTTEALEKAILNPDFMLKVVTELKKEKDARIVAEQTIQEMTPYYELGKKVGNTKAAITVKEFSEALCKNGYKIGQNNLFRWLVDRGYLYKRGRKYLICQNYLDQKLFDVVEEVYDPSDTEIEKIYVKVMITGKGQDYFLNKFEEEKNLASIQGE